MNKQKSETHQTPLKPAAPAPAEVPAGKTSAESTENIKSTESPESTDPRAGRRFSVGTETKNGKRKVRYIETSDHKKGCRFL